MENNNMENSNEINNNETKPKKKVTKETLRNRQLGGVVVICLVVLILFIIIANSCSNSGEGSKDSDKAKNTTTTSEMATTTVPIVTTVPATTTHPLAAQVQIDMTEVYINEGEMKMPFISGYPEGASEANEVWTSLDPTIATVDNYGHITGVARGETFVILSFDNLPGVEVQIRVSVADTSAASDAAVPSLSSSDVFGVESDTYTTTASMY